MKPWQGAIIKFLTDELGRTGRSMVRVSVTAIQDYLSERGFRESMTRIGKQLGAWDFPRRRVRSRMGRKKLREVHREGLAKLVEKMQREKQLQVPGALPFHCYRCGWSGYCVVKSDEEIEDGCRIVKKKEKPKDFGKLCLCPKCKDGGQRAYLKRGMKINWQDGPILF